MFHHGLSVASYQDFPEVKTKLGRNYASHRSNPVVRPGFSTLRLKEATIVIHLFYLQNR